jgi:hypothetical protein
VYGLHSEPLLHHQEATYPTMLLFGCRLLLIFCSLLLLALVCCFTTKRGMLPRWCADFTTKCSGSRQPFCALFHTKYGDPL